MTTGDEAAPGDERTTDERPAGAPAAEADTGAAEERAEGEPGDTAAALLESAAEIVVGAAIAPFTGGETMPIVATVAEALEGGVDRLTHLGHPHPAEREHTEDKPNIGEAANSEPPRRGDPSA